MIQANQVESLNFEQDQKILKLKRLLCLSWHTPPHMMDFLRVEEKATIQ